MTTEQWPKPVTMYLHPTDGYARRVAIANGLSADGVDEFDFALDTVEVKLLLNQDGTYTITDIKEIH